MSVRAAAAQAPSASDLQREAVEPRRRRDHNVRPDARLGGGLDVGGLRRGSAGSAQPQAQRARARTCSANMEPANTRKETEMATM